MLWANEKTAAAHPELDVEILKYVPDGYVLEVDDDAPSPLQRRKAVVTDDEIMTLFAGGRYETWANDRRDRIVAVLRARVFTENPIEFSFVANLFGVTAVRMRQIFDQCRVRIGATPLYQNPELELRLIEDFPRYQDLMYRDDEWVAFLKDRCAQRAQKEA